MFRSEEASEQFSDTTQVDESWKNEKIDFSLGKAYGLSNDAPQSGDSFRLWTIELNEIKHIFMVQNKFPKPLRLLSLVVTCRMARNKRVLSG